MALPALSIASSPLLVGATAWAESEKLELERFIYDPRYAEAVDIAARAGELGIKLSPVSDNLMELWYDELDLKWKQAPMALAGVTLAEALFVLETLALDYRMRVVYRGAHAAAENGRIRHTLVGPAALVERLATLGDDAAWEAELAGAMASCPIGEPERGQVEFTTAAPALPLRDETVYSWIIAPRSAVALTIPS